jgi:hypothetical protein
MTEWVNNSFNSRHKFLDKEKPIYKYCALDYWSLAYVKDELTCQLSSTCSFTINKEAGQIHITHKYYDKAEWHLNRINVWDPSTEFVINLSDLTLRLQNELEQLHNSSPQTFDKVVTEAVQTILESVNQRYYHVNGLSYKIKWRFAA